MSQDNKKPPPPSPTKRIPSRNHDYIEYVVPGQDSINKRSRIAPVQKIPEPTPKPKR